MKSDRQVGAGGNSRSDCRYTCRTQSLERCLAAMFRIHCWGWDQGSPPGDPVIGCLIVWFFYSKEPWIEWLINNRNRRGSHETLTILWQLAASRSVDFQSLYTQRAGGKEGSLGSFL